MPSQIRLQYPPGLNIRQPEILKLALIGGGGDVRDVRDARDARGRPTSGDPSSTVLAVDVQPRIRNLQLPIRARSRRIGVDGAFLRKRLGHAAVMAACARQRMHRRRAALQAAMLARWFNLTGEWDSDSPDSSVFEVVLG